MFRVRDYFYFDNFAVGGRFMLLVVLVEELAHFFGAGGFLSGSSGFGIGRGLRGVGFGLRMDLCGYRLSGGGSFRFRIFLGPLRRRFVRRTLLWNRCLLLLRRMVLRCRRCFRRYCLRLRFVGRRCCGCGHWVIVVGKHGCRPPGFLSQVLDVWHRCGADKAGRSQASVFEILPCGLPVGGTAPMGNARFQDLYLQS